MKHFNLSLKSAATAACLASIAITFTGCSNSFDSQICQTDGITFNWCADTLGDKYEMRHVPQPDDYSGEVISTIIRHKQATDSITTGYGIKKGVLYVHGFNDYFFNAEMGEKFAENGYEFYAVDLRKYGRSILPAQRKFEVRSLDEYFPDIDSALVEMNRNGIGEIALMGHSTGGLITAYYMASRHDKRVNTLLLNSPFLDWNLGGLEKFVPAVSWAGGFAPEINVPQGESKAYAESLLSKYHGEWDYNTDWKLEISPDVTAGWVHAIDSAQKSLRNGKAGITVPVLLMYSEKTIDGAEWTAAHNNGDCVLDVNDIYRYGKELGNNVKCVTVKGGLHDLLLSQKPVREGLYSYIFQYLQSVMPEARHTETE